jgi:hypothetical protein
VLLEFPEFPLLLEQAAAETAETALVRPITKYVLKFMGAQPTQVAAETKWDLPALVRKFDRPSRMIRWDQKVSRPGSEKLQRT